MWEFRMGSSHAQETVSKNEAQTGGTPKGDSLLFFRNFFRHPRMLGPIIPGSRFLIKQLLQPIDWDKARVIVEYGPGVGGITAEILRRMRPDARLIAIEMNPEFVSFLRKTLVDERIQVVEASAADVRDIMQKFGHAKADYIISGIPLRSMPPAVREPILRNTCAAAGPPSARGRGWVGSRFCAIPARRWAPADRFWCFNSPPACCLI